MHQAQPGQADGHPVEPMGGNRELATWPQDITSLARSYNITLRDVARLLASRCKAAIARRAWTRPCPPAALDGRAPPARSPSPTGCCSSPRWCSLMVVVGGITRLTESGLSITEWKPVSGAIPPLTHADWQHAFDLYQATPEYRRSTARRAWTSPQFKFIYFWEWVHRLLGRLIGLAFALPLAWFAVKRAIPERLWLAAGRAARCSAEPGRARLVHGHVGPGRPHRRQPFPPVGASAARLVHHGGADLDRARPAPAGANRRRPPCPPDRACRVATAAILFVQLLLGAWVAGLDAGYVASDWPLMQGQLRSRRHRLEPTAPASRSPTTPILHPLPPPLVGVGRGRGAGRLRAPGASRSTAAPRSPSTPPSAPRSCSASPP